MTRREHQTSTPAPAPDSATKTLWSGIDQWAVMSMELIAGFLTWAGIGWLVDRWLGTAPWFFVAGALVGNAAGIYLIWLRANRLDERERARQRSALSTPDEEAAGHSAREGDAGG